MKLCPLDPSHLSVGILCLMAVTAACSPAPQSSEAADRATLDQLRREFAAAENAGDADAMYRYLASDIVVMAPNVPPMRGAELTPASLRSYFEQFDMKVEYRSEEIVIAGDWAFDRGTGRETITPKKGGAPVGGESKYLWVYRKVGGEWKQARVIWNSSEPLPGTGPQPSQ